MWAASVPFLGAHAAKLFQPRLPARGARSDGVYTGGWVSSAATGMLGTASWWAAWGPHLASPPDSPPRVQLGGRRASPTPVPLGSGGTAVPPAVRGGSMSGSLLTVLSRARGSEQVCARPHRPLACCSLGWGWSRAGRPGWPPWLRPRPGLPPSLPVACGHSYCGGGSKPG